MLCSFTIFWNVKEKFGSRGQLFHYDSFVGLLNLGTRAVSCILSAGVNSKMRFFGAKIYISHETVVT